MNRAAWLRSRFWMYGCRLLAIVVLAFGASLASGQAGQDLSRVPGPAIEKARGGQCVAEPAYMRRNHMNLLKHQRDDTVRVGTRTGRFSLKSCIDCHASATTRSVSASPDNFCQSCHTYAAVSIDCFECHTHLAQEKP